MPPGTSLQAVRAAWLRRLAGSADATWDGVTTTVGAADCVVGGRTALALDMERLGETSDDAREFRLAAIPLRCGLWLRADILDDIREPLFSVRSLVRRRRDVHLDRTRDRIDAVPAPMPRVPATPPGRPGTPLFPVVEHVLVLLGDAVLGSTDWLPDCRAAPREAEDDPRDRDPAWLMLWEIAPWLGDACTVRQVTEVVGIPPGGRPDPAWCEAAAERLRLAARARWQEGLDALSGAVDSQRGRPIGFGKAIAGLIAERPPADAPLGRWTAEGRGVFSLDPVGRVGDVLLLRWLARRVPSLRALWTWAAQAWPAATECVAPCVREPGERAQFVSIHRALWPNEASSEGAFRELVSFAGKHGWSMSEVVAAVHLMRRAGESDAELCSRVAPHLTKLPRRAWSSQALKEDGRWSLERIVAWLQ